MKCEAHTRPPLTTSSMHLAASGLGQSINPKLAGLIGRHGPQNKQPFMVAFFKATEVHLRSTRSTGGRQRGQNRSKTPKNQEALRMANVAGTPGVGGSKLRLQGPRGAHRGAIQSHVLHRWFWNNAAGGKIHKPRCCPELTLLTVHKS